MSIKLGPFCTSVWAVSNSTWAVLVIQNGPIGAVLDITWAVFGIRVGRFGFGPFWSMASGVVD